MKHLFCKRITKNFFGEPKQVITFVTGTAWVKYLVRFWLGELVLAGQGVGRRFPKRGWSLGGIGDFAYSGVGSLRTKKTGAAPIFKAAGIVIISP
jgi:hypothetical protein